MRHERLARIILPTAESDPFYSLFDYIESPYFDVASDAFASLKDILTKHKVSILQEPSLLIYAAGHTQILASASSALSSPFMFGMRYITDKLDCCLRIAGIGIFISGKGLFSILRPVHAPRYLR